MAVWKIALYEWPFSIFIDKHGQIEYLALGFDMVKTRYLVLELDLDYHPFFGLHDGD